MHRQLIVACPRCLAVNRPHSVREDQGSLLAVSLPDVWQTVVMLVESRVSGMNSMVGASLDSPTSVEHRTVKRPRYRNITSSSLDVQVTASSPKTLIGLKPSAGLPTTPFATMSTCIPEERLGKQSVLVLSYSMYAYVSLEELLKSCLPSAPPMPDFRHPA